MTDWNVDRYCTADRPKDKAGSNQQGVDDHDVLERDRVQDEGRHVGRGDRAERGVDYKTDADARDRQDHAGGNRG